MGAVMEVVMAVMEDSGTNHTRKVLLDYRRRRCAVGTVKDNPTVLQCAKVWFALIKVIENVEQIEIFIILVY